MGTATGIKGSNAKTPYRIVKRQRAQTLMLSKRVSTALSLTVPTEHSTVYYQNNDEPYLHSSYLVGLDLNLTDA